MSKENWKALESNPEVMNHCLADLGFKTEEFSICDLYALEEWAFGMVPKPVIGLLLLFPYDAKHKEFVKTQEEAFKVFITCTTKTKPLLVLSIASQII